KKKKWEPPLLTHIYKKKRERDLYATSKLPAGEFVQNQERLKPQEEKAQEEKTRVDLRGSSMGVESLENITDDNRAIVSSTRPEYYVSILSFVDVQFCYICGGVLQDDTDPMVSVMKLEKAPTELHADIGVLEQQIQGIKES
ncbi:6821_t:CDS:2, partial [Cetraspora pellucida]